MDATIVIPVKNGGEKLKKVLDAIENQNTDYEYEIVCIDSGSKDDSVDTIKQHSCILKEISPEEFGHGKTRNLGASLGTGRYILFLTQDALPANNNWLQSMLKAMDEDESIAGGFGKHLPYPDCNLPDRMMIENHFAKFGEENQVFRLSKENSARYYHDRDFQQFLAFFSDNNSCLRRSVWEKLPYDDVDYAEDQLWARNILEHGYGKLYCPKCIVFHSHNFPLKEYKKRYFDDFKAVYKVFGRPKKGRGQVSLKNAFGTTLREWKYISKQKDISLKDKVYWKNYSFMRNLLRHRASVEANNYYDLTDYDKKNLDKRYSQQFEEKK